ncbi:ACT domain-containing protein ACR1 [Ricinus communis]|uniref:ACT domain-containing protein ACR n=1 Tax=Ricinus communis TaxID=3988 RepID=B9SH32_RICCO|nr:ACT domain-containing protein ACR1 [Ricinus communis]XP_015578527.1 ACT domain-containing protein ACR1 [Ricinus communis]XP_025014234.1 ACT domain-containing protein ACR1 [Ricinus communis]XP_048232479.1 ACT domain-containing protein ACR1 [Ricinus communis]XP_048232480.1 ACT domain-containing protein ACR1 [Ricinus communis]EEF37129.1 amino acid binding protein, putative [Ricinus communis]|eukprot:XP_002525301.1 ACT domain-containing protein ACR1 [Ricinus communis]
MEIAYQPYIDPEFESLIERIYPPRVCIDNEACQDCTVVKVDSANKHGILLEMVQVLTDLDLVISKSYICSDGGWFMDVFHVTDQLGNKLTDESLILYIQQALCTNRRAGASQELQNCLKREVRPRHVSTDHTAMEMTGIDRPGMLSEISAVLAELQCHVTAAVAWTHNSRAACIIYMEDGLSGGPITDSNKLAHVEEQLQNVVEAHHGIGEMRSVRLASPVTGQTHTERRLHQLMSATLDYEPCCGCTDGDAAHQRNCTKIHVSIESCKEKGYSVVNMRSMDRPKLLFDTLCALTDMQYVVFHAAVSSKGTMARQEYFIRHKDGCTLDTESERHKLTKCLIAATERRASHGLRLDISTHNRVGLLSDVTRVFRENGLSISRAEIGLQGDRAVGSFYITDASGDEANTHTLELVRKEIGGSVLVVNKSPGWTPRTPSTAGISRTSSGSVGEEKPKFSLGSLLWSQLERLSGNFGSIRS